MRVDRIKVMMVYRMVDAVLSDSTVPMFFAHCYDTMHSTPYFIPTDYSDMSTGEYCIFIRPDGTIAVHGRHRGEGYLFREMNMEQCKEIISTGNLFVIDGKRNCDMYEDHVYSLLVENFGEMCSVDDMCMIPCPVLNDLEQLVHLAHELSDL